MRLAFIPSKSRRGLFAFTPRHYHIRTDLSLYYARLSK
jgi:hypothetical protein